MLDPGCKNLGGTVPSGESGETGLRIFRNFAAIAGASGKREEAMLTNRLIACFDIRNGMVTKAHKFQDNIDILPAEEMARQCMKTGSTRSSSMT